MIPDVNTQESGERLVLFKSEEIFSFDKLSRSIQHVELFGCNTESKLWIPSHISTFNIVRSQDIVAIEDWIPIDNSVNYPWRGASDCLAFQTSRRTCCNLSRFIGVSDYNTSSPLHQPTLKVLDIQACQSLKRLPAVHLCTHLEEIRFCWFSQEITIPSLADCQNCDF